MAKKKTETEIVKYDTPEAPTPAEKPKRKPREKPAPATTAPAEPLTDPLEEAIKKLTPEQLEIGERQAEAARVYLGLLKAGKNPKKARYIILKRFQVRINPNE